MSDEEKHEAIADLTLRSQPRPVSRLSRKAIMGGAAASGGLLFGAMLFAMKPPSVRTTEAALLPTTAMKPVNEAVDGLPRSYEEVAAPLPSGPMAALVPQLGPPLPGDLGSGLVETERSLGIDAAADLPAYDDDGLPFLPDAENEAMRVERIRQARITAEAREADVFFTLRSGGVVTGALAAADPPIAMGAGPTVTEPRGSLTGPYLAPGTVIRASLLTAVNSDLPGTAIAQVTEDVTDSQTGSAVLIPRGARLIGRYGNEVGAFQSRADVRWNRLVLPDGEEVLLSDLPALDETGAAGLEDEVDHHTGRLVRAGLLSSLLGVGTELTVTGDGGTAQAVRQALQGTTNAAGQSLVQQGAAAQPTLRIRAGFEFALVLERALPLPLTKEPHDDEEDPTPRARVRPQARPLDADDRTGPSRRAEALRRCLRAGVWRSADARAASAAHDPGVPRERWRVQGGEAGTLVLSATARTEVPSG